MSINNTHKSAHPEKNKQTICESRGYPATLDILDSRTAMGGTRGSAFHLRIWSAPCVYTACTLKLPLQDLQALWRGFPKGIEIHHSLQTKVHSRECEGRLSGHLREQRLWRRNVSILLFFK